MSRNPEQTIAWIGCVILIVLAAIPPAGAVACDGPPQSQSLVLPAGGCNQSPATVPCTETFRFPAQPSQGGDPPTQYYLDSGDGQPPYYGFNDFASHTYEYPGTYLVKYRAGTACDYWIEGTHTLVVAEPPNYTPVLHGCPPARPQAAFSGAPLTGTAPLTVQFTGASTGADAWHWDFGDGTSSPAQNPRHTYQTAGLYSVTLEARDICTGAVSTAGMSHYVTITVPAGTLALTTEPRGASVFIDNAFKGVTPLTLTDTPSGYHVVLLKLPGYDDYSTGVTVDPAKTVLVQAALANITANATTAIPTTVLTTIAPQANGSVAVTSVPNGASVTFDGRYEGTTPVIIADVLPGNHEISLGYPGYDTYNRTISVGSKETTAVNANLAVPAKPAPAPNTGSLIVITDPAGAQVSVDGEVKGVSPATIPGLSPGPHTVFLQREDYYDLSATVTITAGQTQNYTTGLRKAFRPSAVEVVLAGLVVLIVIGAGLYRLLRKDEI